jgi:hypothetical protein
MQQRASGPRGHVSSSSAASHRVPGVVPRRPRATSSSTGPRPTTAVSSSGVKLPSTHLESSKRALEQLKASAVNREWPGIEGGGFCPFVCS